MDVHLREIPRDTWRGFRVQALVENTSAQQLLIRVVSDYLKTAKVK